MPALIECIYNGKTISVAEALNIKERLPSASSDGNFICPECGNPVKPHRSGGNTEAHFEHLERHQDCSLSHKSREQDNKPDWCRDELILALNLYLSHRPNPPDKASREVTGLSNTLRLLGEVLFPSYEQSESFRNANGVYMKLMNFRRLDPQYTSDGRKGLTRGAKGEEDVWKEFATDPARCKSVADAIISGVNDASVGISLADDVDEGIEEAAEGRLLTRQHVSRERNRKLVDAKRKSVLKKFGKLECEVCGFDFVTKYGTRGQGFIECHHTKPLATLSEGSKTHINDLALVCSNCHRMIHRCKQWMAINELKALLKEVAGVEEV